MKEKFLLFYYFTDGAFHTNATYFMVTNLGQKLERYLGKKYQLNSKINKFFSR